MGYTAITVRFTDEAMKVIDELATSHGKSKAEIIRTAVDKNLLNYLSHTVYVEPKQGQEIKAAMYELTTELQNIKSELNRIGVNYNQELRLKQLEMQPFKSYEALKAKAKKIEEIKQTCLPADYVTELLSRYEAATERIGEILCHIVE